MNETWTIRYFHSEKLTKYVMDPCESVAPYVYEIFLDTFMYLKLNHVRQTCKPFCGSEGNGLKVQTINKKNVIPLSGAF